MSAPIAPKPIAPRTRKRLKALFAHPRGAAVLVEEIYKMPEPFGMADLMKALHRAFNVLGLPPNPRLNELPNNDACLADME